MKLWKKTLWKYYFKSIDQYVAPVYEVSVKFELCSHKLPVINKYINGIARVSSILMFNSWFGSYIWQFNPVDPVAKVLLVKFSVVFSAVHLNALCNGAVPMNMRERVRDVCILCCCQNLSCIWFGAFVFTDVESNLLCSVEPIINKRVEL